MTETVEAVIFFTLIAIIIVGTIASIYDHAKHPTWPMED